jgi:hypothetical protein
MSSVTITRQELLELWHGLPALAGLKGFKLGYAVARTKAKLKPEIEALDEALKPDADFQKYEERRMALCRKYVQKDPQGNPVVSGNEFVFGENREAFDAEIAPLQEEFAGAIGDRRKQTEDYLAGLKEPITVDVHQIAPEDVPEDATVAQIDVLYRLIKAEE